MRAAPRVCIVSSSCSVFEPGAAHMSSVRWCGRASRSNTGTIETASCTRDTCKLWNTFSTTRYWMMDDSKITVVAIVRLWIN